MTVTTALLSKIELLMIDLQKVIRRDYLKKLRMR